MNGEARETNEGGIRPGVSRYPLVVSYLLYYLAFISFVLYWALGMLWVFIFCGIGGLFISGDRSKQLADRFIHRFFKLYFLYAGMIGVVRMDTSELDVHRGEDEEAPVIVAANHPALWDVALLLCHFRGLTCIMKQSLLRNPCLRTPAKWAGFIPNAPSFLFSRKASERLDKGGDILLFPEGTRSKKGVLNPFNWGIGMLAKRHSAPVLPVFIYSDSRFLEKGWTLWRAPELPIRVTIKSGEIQRPAEGEKVRDFTLRLQQYFVDEIERRRPL